MATTSTTRTFNAMLNEYLPTKLLEEELLKRDYIFNKIEKDTSYKGSKVIIPFRGSNASSVTFGNLTGSTDISESSYVRGEISAYTELWGSLIFNYRDLADHSGKIPESTFLRILPDEVDNFMDYIKMVASISMTSGPHFAKVTDSTNAATGIFIVDKVDRFVLGQKVTLDDDNSATVSAYVIAINLNTKAVTFSDSRGGSAFDFSAYTAAQNAKFYYPGVWDGTNTVTFTSFRSAFLSSANGGSSTLHGQTKTAYPMLQAVNIDGASITASNILDKIFDAYSEIRQRARGNATTVLMSFKHLGSVMKQVQLEKGPFSVVKQPSASQYGWTEIEIMSVKGSLTIVGIQEMLDTEIFFVDWSSMKFYSNGLFSKATSPDGLQYFVVRNATGYQYICDIRLWGEIGYHKPNSNGIIYGIDY